MTAINGAPTTIGGLPVDPDPLTGDERFPFSLTLSGPTYRGQISDIVTLAVSGTYVPVTRAVNTIDSLQGGGPLSADLTLSLQGDAASPGNSRYYGTDTGGSKGYHTLAGLNIAASQITGLVSVIQGGTGTATPSLIPGSGIIITGTWPDQTISTSATGGTVTSVATGTGLTGGTITTAGTVSLADTAVSPGAYIGANITVDQQGRITSAGNGPGGTVTSVATGTGLTGGPVTSTGTISLADTAVTPGAYTSANITVDQQGRITHAANGAGGGTVTSVASGTGLTGGPITGSGTLSLTNTGVSANSYTLAAITVDAQGRLTAAASGALPSIADQRLLANISGGAASPSANTLTAILDNILGSTQGQIIFRSSSAWTVLATGTAGQGLQSGGAAADISWTSNFANTGVATQWTKQVNGATPVPLSDAAPTAWSLANSNTFTWTLGADHLLSNPTGSVSGGNGIIYIDQAGFTATFDTNIKLVGTLPPSGETICGFYINGSNVTIVVGGLTGF